MPTNQPRLNSRSHDRRASRKILLFVLAVTGVAPARVAAQSEGDSLAVRLRRLEAAMATLQQQVAEQSESGVKTRSGARVTFAGRVAMNAFGNSRRVNNVDDPQFVLVDAPSGIGSRGGGMTMRHTRLSMAVTGGEILGTRASAFLDVDFHGGQVPSSGGRHFPLIRLRTAHATMWFSQAEIMIGQDAPLISGVNPESPAAIGTPLFAGSGNLWLWLPQARLTAFTSSRKRFGIQAAALAPASGEPIAPFHTDHDAAERSSQPVVQVRAFARLGDDPDRASEVGCGAHRGWLVPAVDEKQSSAVACDLQLRIADRADVRGEFFTGQALRGLGGGGIGQNVVGAANDPVETTGGWAQVNLAATERVQVGAGCGVDHPSGDVLRRRNDSCAAYAQLRPVGAYWIGAEGRRTRTEYASGRYTNDHVTLALGFEF